MFKGKNKLSSLEWELMEIIWREKNPVSVRRVREIAYPRGEKAYTTVQTVMNNLVGKGFLAKEKIGLVNFYRPLRDHQKSLLKEVKTFAGVTFGGSLPALASFLIDSDSLTSDEIAALKRLIDEKTGKGGENG